MNQQNGFRRSGSLPPTSGISMGRLSMGPQRVPNESAAPSASGFGSAMRRFNSVSSVNQNSSVKQSRTSMAPASGGGTAVKDTRPFGDKVYRERTVRQLVEFLSSHGYPHAINIKGSNGPSTTDFKKIFEFMVSLLEFEYKLTGRLEEEVPRILKSHGYPVTITNSHMRTIGVPSTWVVLLGALTYLRTIIEQTEFTDLDNLLFRRVENDDGSVPKTQMFNNYVENCYSNFLAGNDDEILVIRDRFMQDMENAAIPLSDVQALEEEVKHNLALLDVLQSTPNEVAKLMEEVDTLEVDSVKLNQYVAQMEQYRSSLDCQLKASEKNLQQKIAEKTALELDIQQKSKLFCEQRISGFDAERLNNERKAVKNKLALAEKALNDIDKQLMAAEELVQSEQEAVNVVVAEFNSKARLLRLIPYTAECAGGLDLEMRPLLTEKESHRYETDIGPALHLISRQRMEKCRLLEEEFQQSRETLKHYSDIITQHKDELTILMNAVTAIDLSAEQSKQVHLQEVQNLLASIDELSNAINTNRPQQGLLDSKRRLIKEANDSLEQERVVLQAEEDRASVDLIDFSKKMVAHKEKVKRMLQQILDVTSSSDLEHEIVADIKTFNSIQGQ